MLGKKFLKRFTRLGLSSYLMMWCMSFTVCAYDNPIADLAVAGEVNFSLMSEAYEGTGLVEDEIPLEAVLDDEDSIVPDEDLIDSDSIESREDAMFDGNAAGSVESEADAESEDTEATAGESMPEEESVDELPDADETVLGDEATAIDEIIEDESDNLLGYYDIDSWEYVESLNLKLHEMIVTDQDYVIYTGVDNYVPSNASLNESRLYWTLLYPDGSEIPSSVLKISPFEKSIFDGHEIHRYIHVDCSGLTESLVFFIQVEYRNSLEGPEMAANPKDVCRVQFVRSSDEDGIEINLLQNSCDFEIFKNYNNISYIVKADFTDKYSEEMLGSPYPSPIDAIEGAEFEDSELNKLFEFRILDGDKMIVNITEDVRYDRIKETIRTAEEINAIVTNKKYSSKVVFTYVRADGTRGQCTSKDALILNIKRSLPKVKAQNIVINPYQAGSQKIIPVFTGEGLNTKSLWIDESEVPKGITDAWEEDLGCYLKVGTDFDVSKKSGKIPVHIALDTAVWCTATINSVKVDVPYTVKNVPPKFQITGTKKITVNPYTASSGGVLDSGTSSYTATYSDYEDAYYSEIAAVVLDSKNKDVSDNLTIRTQGGTLDPRNTKDGVVYVREGEIIIRCNEKTLPGQTYKVKLFLNNTLNGQNTMTKAVVLTVKTVAAKDAAKVDVSLGSKGSVDAMKFGSELKIIVNSKNAGLIRPVESSFAIVTADADKRTVTDYFDINYDYDDTITISEESSFDLLRQGLEGKKLNFSSTFEYLYCGPEGNMTKQIYASKIFTVGKSTVAPKLSTTKASINPYIDSNFRIKYSFPNMSKFNVSYDILVGGNVAEHNDTAYLGYIDIGDTTILNASGKTIEVRVAPKNPPYMAQERVIKEFKNATCKITVLNPVKAKVSGTATVKGSINSIKDTVYANVTIKLKNMYAGTDYASHVEALDYSVYTLDKKKGRTDYTDDFWIYNGNYDDEVGRNFLLTRNMDKDFINAGTYKCDLKYGYVSGYDSEEKPIKSYFNVTFNLKVTRGSVSLLSSKKQAELLNDNTRRDTFVISAKDKTLNPISNIEVADKSSPFKANYLGNGKVSLGYSDGRHVENDKKGNPITKAVTKTVKFKVYFVGSNKPNTISLKVRISP